MEILTGALFRADVVSAAQTAQTMCFCCSLSTAREIMEIGVIPTSLLTNGQLNCWFTPRGALLRTLQMHWAGIGTELDKKVTVLCWNPSLHRFLTSATVHQLTTNFIDESNCGSTDSFQQALRGPLLDKWCTGRQRHAFGQDGMPFWIWHPTSFHCKRTELQSTVWNALQRTGWSLYSHSESSSTDA